MSETRPPLRVHQQRALAVLDGAWSAGRRRAWVTLPPGAGKTRVGLEAMLRLRAQVGDLRTVVLGPNTAIQGQWLAAASCLGVDVGVDRDLSSALTALTYQSVAVFDEESEDAEPPAGASDRSATGTLLDRLHDHGREIVSAMRAAGPLLLVLDECHHLLEVWGRLLGELLDEVPAAWVLGLTATPPETLTPAQAELVADLFGAPLFQASIPAVVREGDLAPFVELAWVTTPTPTEQDWLAAEATRFTELATALVDPAFGSTPFLAWVDARFASPQAPWATLVHAEPDLARAAMRLHHAGLVALPPGARPTEETRRDPTADDWVLLIEDWLLRSVATSGRDEDARVLDAVRQALPSVGYQWTRRGVRRGRSPVDRVLARSAAKADAVAQIAAREHLALGDRLRLLVLADHERAGATLPATLTGVLPRQSGSAIALLDALTGAPEADELRPMLVSGRTVAGGAAVLHAFLADLARSGPADRLLATGLSVVPLDDDEPPEVAVLWRVDGPWTSRIWVPAVTRWFAAGGTRVLIGTRALLGEGWDAPWVTGVADVTTATTSTAVVQARGRALRTDPAWPGKVAVNWSLVCVTDRHPRGGSDWDRLVRKHRGYFGPDVEGEIVDGVAHLDPAFSPFGPPDVADLDAANARAVVRGEQRDRVREQWRVGAPYDDSAVPALRIRPGAGAARLGGSADPAAVVLRPEATEVRHLVRPPVLRHRVVALAALAAIGFLVAVITGAWWWALPGAVLAMVAAVDAGWSRQRYGAQVLMAAAEPPSVLQIASAVADALHATGQASRGADAVVVAVDADGEYRCRLSGVSAESARRFAEALDHAVAPIDRPRYVVPRWVRSPPDPTDVGRWGALRIRWRAAGGEVTPDGETWHPVPELLGTTAQRAGAYAAAWDRWIGGGPALRTDSPQGAGVLAAQLGADPFDVTSVVRRAWA